MYFYVHAWGPQRSQEGVKSPGALELELQFRDTAMWELNPGHLEGQILFLTTEQPIQSQHYELWMGPLFWKKSQLLLSIFCLEKNTSYLAAENKSKASVDAQGNTHFDWSAAL